MPARVITAPSRPSETSRMASAQNTYESSVNTTSTNHIAAVVSEETMCEGIDNVL